MTAAEHKEKAALLLINYFQAIATKAGMRWDNDYTIEICEAVDHIVDAAFLQTAAAVRELKDGMAELLSDIEHRR